MIKYATGFLKRHSQINIVLFDQALISASNFVTGILLARGLGLAGFGEYSLAWLVVLFVQRTQHAAINAPMMSIGPKQNDTDKSAYYGGIFFQQAIFATSSATLTWVCIQTADFLMPDLGLSRLALPLAAAVFTTQNQDLIRRFYFTEGKPLAGLASDTIRFSGQVAAIIWILFFSDSEKGIVDVLWIMAATSLAGSLIVLRVRPGLQWTASSARQAFNRNWRFSIWLIPSSMLQWLSRNLFVIVAGGLLGTAAIGALKAAQNLMGLTHILFQGLENIVPVRAAQHFHTGGRHSLNRYLAKVASLGAVAVTVVVLFFAIDPDFWFRLLYGDEFVEYSFLVRWYAALHIIVYFELPLRFGLMAMERTAPVFKAHLFATAFSVSSAYYLISSLGLQGAMIGMIAYQLILQGTLFASLRRP